MQAAEGWEGGEDETDCSFRGFAVVEERNTAVVCGVKWFFFFFLSFFPYSTGLNMFIGQGKYTVEKGKLNIQEREGMIHRASS